jgi:hypothetical protein
MQQPLVYNLRLSDIGLQTPSRCEIGLLSKIVLKSETKL